MQEAPCAAAGPLDKVLDGGTVGQNPAELFVEYCGVKLLGTKASAQIECSALADKSAENREVHIVSGGYMGRQQSVLINEVGNQQVVDVTAMTGYVDDFVIRRQFLEFRKRLEFHTIVNPFPEPG